VSRVIRFGAGALGDLADVAAELGLERLLLVTTRRGAAAAGEVPVAGVYDGVRSHVPVETVREAAERARALDADGLVGLGGGSAIDACKAVTAELLPERELRTIAVPTTYAGAEWTPYFGLLLAPGRKGGGSHERAKPVAAIYDPELTPSAATGMPIRARRRSGTRCRSSWRGRASCTRAPGCWRERSGQRSRSSRPAWHSVTPWLRRSVAVTGCRRAP
jgi:alcohol dehydrogenase class IV